MVALCFHAIKKWVLEILDNKKNQGKVGEMDLKIVISTYSLHRWKIDTFLKFPKKWCPLKVDFTREPSPWRVAVIWNPRKSRFPGGSLSRKNQICTCWFLGLRPAGCNPVNFNEILIWHHLHNLIFRCFNWQEQNLLKLFLSTKFWAWKKKFCLKKMAIFKSISPTFLGFAGFGRE